MFFCKTLSMSAFAVVFGFLPSMGHGRLERSPNSRLDKILFLQDQKHLRADDLLSSSKLIDDTQKFTNAERSNSSPHPSGVLVRLLLNFNLTPAFNPSGRAVQLPVDDTVFRATISPKLRSSYTCMKRAVKKKPTSKTAQVATGFGAVAKSKKVKKTVSAQVPLDPSIAAALATLAEGEQCLENYLNPKLFEDPATMEGISKRLQAGEVVVLRDAFRPEFAEMVYSELKDDDVAWELNEDYFPDGYAHRHHNVYDKTTWSARLNSTLDVFANDKSKNFMQKLTGRDCSGDTLGSPSWYKEGDHSLPHTDWVGQRTVAYVWHLSKDWKPEWGGGLYWAQYEHAVATYPASFNTLVLFCVTTRSAHFVTTVSPHHRGKRLTFNGWWQSGFLPRTGSEIEELLVDETMRQGVTHSQMQAMTDSLADPFTNFNDQDRERLEGLRKGLMQELFPHGIRAGLEA